MPNRWAVANGNWSSTATWNGGTLPTSADDVFANNFTVTIDQNIDVISLNTTSTTGVNAGGGFTLTGNFNVTCTSPTWGITPGSSACLTYNGTGTVIVTANVRGSSTTANISGINITGTGNITIVGIVQPGVGGGSVLSAIIINANATVSVIGNVSTLATSNSAEAIRINTSCTLNITGDLLVPNGASVAILFAAFNQICTLNITGNLTSLSTGGVPVIWTGTQSGKNLTINITGNLSGKCISIASTRFVTSNDYPINISVVGNVTGTSTDCAIDFWIPQASATIAGIITNGQQIPGRSRIAVYILHLYLVPSINTYWRFYTNTGQLSLVPYYASGFVPDQPTQNNVRQGVSYGLGTLTGTMIVASPANIRKGVPTDNTVGTAELTAQDFLDAISASTNPIAVRLKNVSTVQSTGDQLNSQ